MKYKPRVAIDVREYVCVRRGKCVCVWSVCAMLPG